MILNVELPTVEDLAPLSDEALDYGNVTSSDFVSNHCAGIIEVLSKDPLRYRDYGAYWWPVKRILINQGYGDFVGDEIEEKTADHFYIENDVSTLCAAWFYQSAMIEDGKMKQSIHLYDVEVDGDFEQFEYSIEDDDLERYKVN